MSYSANDANGYVGDVASIGGWSAFAGWAKKQSGAVRLESLIIFGYSRDPAGLVRELGTLKATDADIDSVRTNLIDLAGRAEEVLILTDGTDGAERESI